MMKEWNRALLLDYVEAIDTYPSWHAHRAKIVDALRRYASHVPEGERPALIEEEPKLRALAWPDGK